MLSRDNLVIRSLLKSPGFTVVAVLTLALCIGANVAIFSVVDSILVRPLPFAEPDRLVAIFNRYPVGAVEHPGPHPFGASIANYYDRRVAIKAFASTAIYQPGRSIIGGAGTPDMVGNDHVSPEFFATLGIPLALGRAFSESEMLPATSHVAILTDAFWRSRFNADPHVLGRQFQLDAEPTTVIGVLPPGFRYLSSEAQIFTPAASAPEERGAGARHRNNYQLIARLMAGSTVDIAQSQVDAFNAQQLLDDPDANNMRKIGYRTKVDSLHADYVSGVQPILVILQAGVLLLLLIGAANLVNLLLIRASSRSKEFAIRQALGAPRRDIARGVLLETTLLAASGGLLGLGVGAAGIRLLAVLGAGQLPLGATIALDGRVAAVAMICSLTVGVALGLPVLWYMLRAWLAPVLQSDTRGGTVGRAAQILRHCLIVAQVALAFVLLAGAGLLGLSLQHVLATAPGFQPDHVLTADLALPEKKYPGAEARLAFIERLLGQLQIQPGVTAVGFTSALPMTDRFPGVATSIEGIDPALGEVKHASRVSAASSGYFQALRIPLREGRLLEDADNHRRQRVCVVDEAFVRRYWPGQSALGHRLSISGEFDEESTHTIIGVVGNIKQKSLSEGSARGSIYFPYRRWPYSPDNLLSIVLRSSLAPEVLAATVRRIVRQLDPELPVEQVQPMQAWVDDSLVLHRSPALLAAIFAGVALLLAAIGTYGVLAYAVSQRRREIGIRMAVGAQPRQVLKQFFRVSAKLLAVGLVLGVLGAWLTGRAMQGVLFGVTAFDAGVLLAAAAVMTLVTMLATFLPSRRASRVDPLVALRAE